MCAVARASAAGEDAEVAPGSHGHARRDETRILATHPNPHRYTQTRINQPPPHVHGKEGVDGSSPSEGLKSLQIATCVVCSGAAQEISMEGVAEVSIYRTFPSSHERTGSREGTSSEQAVRLGAVRRGRTVR